MKAYVRKGKVFTCFFCCHPNFPGLVPPDPPAYAHITHKCEFNEKDYIIKDENKSLYLQQLIQLYSMAAWGSGTEIQAGNAGVCRHIVRSKWAYNI